jgi:uncharacterized protein (DUF1697 family)
VARYAAFLKGMNLGRRRLTNTELASAFATLGFAEVRTFRASGNVAFDTSRQASDRLTAQIEAGLADVLGYPVPTFLRSAAEIREIAAARPFADVPLEAPRGKLQVGLLAQAPSRSTRAEVLAFADERDRLELAGRELYWLPSGPLSDAELDLDGIGRLLGAMTLRTKGTVEQLSAKHFPV